MKRTAFFLALAFVLHRPALAQKLGYFDSEAVLTKMPAYAKAQTELDKWTTKSQKEIEDLRTEVDKLEKAYRAEEVLLTDEMKADRTKVLDAKRKEAQERQNKLFGYEGGYFLKKKELVKPIQDEVFKAVEKVCRQKQLAIMLDKAGDITMVYTDPRHDYTDYVLEELGLGDKDDNPKANK